MIACGSFDFEFILSLYYVPPVLSRKNLRMGGGFGWLPSVLSTVRAVPVSGGCRLICRKVYRRFERRQIFRSSASFISSSRKSGCAMEISASARSHVDCPSRFTTPYSVAMK